MVWHKLTMIKKYLIIGGIFLFSFFISKYAINNVFLASSPRVNPFYLANLGNSIKGTSRDIALIFTFKKQNSSNSINATRSQSAQVPETLFKYVSKGVTAYEKGNGEVTFKINNKEASVKIRQIELNGKKIEVIDLTGE